MVLSCAEYLRRNNFRHANMRWWALHLGLTVCLSEKSLRTWCVGMPGFARKMSLLNYKQPLECIKLWERIGYCYHFIVHVGVAQIIRFSLGWNVGVLWLDMFVKTLPAVGWVVLPQIRWWRKQKVSVNLRFADGCWNKLSVGTKVLYVSASTNAICVRTYGRSLRRYFQEAV